MFGCGGIRRGLIEKEKHVREPALLWHRRPFLDALAGFGYRVTVW